MNYGKTMRRFFFSPRGFRRLLAALLAFSAISAGAAQAAGNTAADMEAVKQALLEDPLFLSHLRDKISSDSINGDMIRDYLLRHPDILVDMQEALAAQSAGGGGTAQQAKLIAANKQLLYHTPHDIILGDKNAEQAILEFYDYNCGYCKRDFAELQKLIGKYKNVKIIMKDYPILGDDSMQAHLVAHAIKQLSPAQYPLFHEKMMRLPGRATEASALAVAKSLGLKEDIIKAAMHSPAVQESLLASARIAYQLGLGYTPVFISGTKILGAVDIKDLPQMLAATENEGKKTQ